MSKKSKQFVQIRIYDNGTGADIEPDQNYCFIMPRGMTKQIMNFVIMNCSVSKKNGCPLPFRSPSPAVFLKCK